MKTNHIYNENCLDTMKRMEDACVDLVVTSPPYDNLRDYKGYSFPFEDIAKELYRVVKEGGVVVWVVGDATIDGDETGTSFRQALFFKECGFNLYDTMIYIKKGGLHSGSLQSYQQKWEYMFVFSKGKPKAVNLLRDRKNRYTEPRVKQKRRKDGSTVNQKVKTQEYGVRYNYWTYSTGLNLSTRDKIAFQHPAVFPEQLAEDHILSWSNKGDLIYDPFMGAGTTAKMCLLNGRTFIGSEISKDYCNLIEERLSSLIQYQPKSQPEADSEPLSLLDILLGDQDEN